MAKLSVAPVNGLVDFFYVTGVDGYSIHKYTIAVSHLRVSRYLASIVPSVKESDKYY